MAVLTVTIGANDYPVYADAAYAGVYLAADALRALPWAALTPDAQGRALVSATRQLLRMQGWAAGEPPTLDGPPAAVQDATSMLAADIAQKPTLGDSAATGSNVKAVGAGSAKVEFFAPVVGSRLPSPVLELLTGLLGPTADAGSIGVGGTAYGSSDCQHSRFNDWDLQPDWPVDRDELLL